MADVHTKEQRSYNMSRIKGKNTAPELMLRSMLHKEGYRFRVNVSDLPGKPDIVLPKYRTVIFVHGCYWHRHKDCRYATTPKTRPDFWQQKFDQNVVRDREALRQLKAAGWRVAIVWECELKNQPASVVRQLKNSLQVI